MKLKDRIAAFVFLGEVIEDYLQNRPSEYTMLFLEASQKAQTDNAWFTQESIRNAFRGVAMMLKEEKLHLWLSSYVFSKKPKTIACIMAGNIPLVGFHDMLCVLVAGGSFVGKLSSKDKHLLLVLGKILCDKAPKLKEKILFVSGLQGISYDAVIATGSTNSGRYFEQYFASHPHIIRKGRSSLAVLSGKETAAQLQALADDIFMYYGLGCRNISKIYFPRGFDVRGALAYFEKYKDYVNHHKWMNNYKYNRAIMKVNEQEFYETSFALFVEDSALVSPTAVVHYEFYAEMEEILHFLGVNRHQLQCVVRAEGGEEFINLGEAQFPALDDYADGVDTLKFLSQL